MQIVQLRNNIDAKENSVKIKLQIIAKKSQTIAEKMDCMVFNS